MPEPVVFHCSSVIGGMVDRAEPWYLQNNQVAYLLNSAPARLHSRHRRGGVSSIGARSDGPYGLFRSDNLAYGQEVLYGIWGNKLYIVPGSGVVDERASGVSLTSGLHMVADGYWQNRTAQYISSVNVGDSEPSVASRLSVITDDNQYSHQASMAPTCIAWFQYRLWCANNLLE